MKPRATRACQNAPAVRVALACLLSVLLCDARAQSPDLDIEAPAQPLSCLMSIRPDRKLPDYPPAVAPGTNAIVRVRLEFSAGDRSPVVEVVFNNGPEAFADAVRSFVADYRLPCLRPGRSYKGVQEFQFVVRRFTNAVLESVARDEDEPADYAHECFDGIRSAPPVQFPMPSRISGQANPGMVLLRLLFIAPDKPPEVTVLFDSGQHRLVGAVLKSVTAYRMKCLQPDDPPLSAVQAFLFRSERNEVTRLVPEITLSQLLSVIKGLKEEKVRFDFTSMSCPFKLVIEPYQPYARNRVTQLGSKDTSRREFIEWLRKVSLDLPPSMQGRVLGEQTTVSVPCAVLDLS